MQSLCQVGKLKLGARAGKYKLGAQTRTGKYKLGARTSKYKLGTRAGKYKLGARAGKYKLGARTGKYKLRASAGSREIQRPCFAEYLNFLLLIFCSFSFILSLVPIVSCYSDLILMSKRIHLIHKFVVCKG